MKYLLLIITAVFIEQAAAAQQITGLWYNADSSRIYEIRTATPGQYEAIIKNSGRKTDSCGFAVIQNLHFNNRKKRYEGTMHAAGSQDACVVRITPSQNKLTLKLSRMYVFNVILRWTHAAANQLPPPVTGT